MKIDRGDGTFFIALVSVVTIVFGSALFFKAQILDDIIYVGRTHLLSLSWNNILVWNQPILGLWGPLPAYSFMLDYLVWGKEHFMFGAHLVNILLHFAACAAFYIACRMLKFPRFAAGLAVIFWAVHPQRAESVAWLSERKDVLLLAIGLWGMVFFMQAVKKKKLSLYILSVILFAAGFCIKPALIGLPIILTAYLWGRYRRKDWLFYAKYCSAFYLLSLVYFIIYKAVTGGSHGDTKLAEELIIIFWRYGSYFVKNFIPYGLNPMYPHFSLADHSLLPLYVTGAAILILLEFIRRKSKKAIYLYLPLFISFTAAVAPGLQKIGDVDFADRYSYFPAVFAVAGVTALLCSLCRKYPKAKKGVVIVSVAFTVIMGAIGFEKVFIWETAESYSSAILDAPRPNYREVIGAAIQSFDSGDFADTLQKVRFLQEEYTDIPPVRKLTIDLFSESITGAILLKQGKTHEGAKKLFKVLSHPKWELLLNTSYGYPRYILLTAAGLSQRAGHKKDAAELYRRLAGLYGSFEPMESEFYLALASLCQNDRATALRHFENAQKLSPHDENIRKNIEILKRQRQ